MPPATWIAIRIELVSGMGEQFWPRPGRILAASSKHTFGHLADAINVAFARWDLAHLWAFELADGTRVAEPDPWEMMDHDHEPTRQLGTLAVDEQFVFEFDFGDSWLHLCTVEQVGLRPSEIFGATPTKPVPTWGWGELPDQYGRRWLDDDGSDTEEMPPNPGFGDLPPIGTFAHLRRFDLPTEAPQHPLAVDADLEPPGPPALRLVPPMAPTQPALHAALSLEESVEAFLLDQAAKIKAATLERHAFALLGVRRDDRTIDLLEAAVDEVFDNLRVHGLRGATPADISQLGVSIRKFAKWAASHQLIQADSVERITERTKTTGAELTAAGRFNDVLDQAILIDEVQRHFQGAAPEPDHTLPDTTWIIDDVSGSSLRLSPLLDEFEPITVDVPESVAAVAQTGWMFTATAERRSGQWTLHDLGTVYI